MTSIALILEDSPVADLIASSYAMALGKEWLVVLVKTGDQAERASKREGFTGSIAGPVLFSPETPASIRKGQKVHLWLLDNFVPPTPGDAERPMGFEIAKFLSQSGDSAPRISISGEKLSEENKQYFAADGSKSMYGNPGTIAKFVQVLRAQRIIS